MSRQPNNRISRAPSPPPPPRPVRHSSLTIRTMNQQSQASVPQTPTSPPPRPYPVYPIPIPPEKFPKALQLYRTYRLAEALAQSQSEPQSATGFHDGFHLHVPGRAQSITSRTSSRPRAASITTSTYDGVTDLSSVVSFDENESPSSAKARAAQGELLSFDGKVVKQRARKRLSPPAKAKAALIRYLGSCWVCRSRRVPCPFEHHDIDSLDRKVRESQSRPQLAPPQPHRQSYSSNSSSSQLTARSASGSHQPAAAGGSQTDTLFGVGGNEQLLDDLASFDADVDIQLSGGPYSDIQLELPAAAPSYAAAPEPQAYTSYPLYQDSGMLKLGVQDGEYFYCRYVRHQLLGGALCNELCIDGEQLQTHFEQQHGSFTRIEEPYRAICSVCESLNSYALGPCTRCGRNNMIQVWVCGNSIRPAPYQPQAPDGMDYQPFSSSSAPYNPSYGMNMDSQWGPPGADQGTYNGGATYGYGNGFQGGNNYGAYGGPGNQGYDYTPQNDSNRGGNQYQGSNYRTTSQTVQKGPVTVGILLLSTAKERWRRQKLLLFFSLILLVAITFGFTHDWIFSKLLMAGPKAAAGIRSNLPVMGLGVVLASFGVCLSVKQLATRRVRRAQCRPRSCPLHALANANLPFECAYVMGGAYS